MESAEGSEHAHGESPVGHEICLPLTRGHPPPQLAGHCLWHLPEELSEARGRPRSPSLLQESPSQPWSSLFTGVRVKGSHSWKSQAGNGGGCLHSPALATTLLLPGERWGSCPHPILPLMSSSSPLPHPEAPDEVLQILLVGDSWDPPYDPM